MIISSNPGLQWAQSYLNRLAALASPPTITTAQRNAVFKLLSDIDTTIGISKFKAIYPFLGGDATSHALNAISSSFKITWNGSLTHSASGVDGDGSTGYGDTGGTPSQLFASQNSAHVTMYLNENVTSECRLFGASNGAAGETSSVIDNSPASIAFGLNSGWANFGWSSGPTPTVTAGLWAFSRNASAVDHHFYKNGVLAKSDSTIPDNASPVNNRNMFILASNNIAGAGGITGFASAQLAFCSFGGELSTDDHANLYKAVQAYQVALGRSV